MILSNSFKNLCTIFFALAILSACNFWQSGENNQKKTDTYFPDELKSEIPFATKEPETYRAKFVITNFIGGEKQDERETSVARDGIKYRYDFPGGVSFLQIKENERLLINKNKNIYARTRSVPFEEKKTNDDLKDFLTTKWLNEKRDAKFEKLGTENSLTKYRVIATDPETKRAETIIHFDEELKLPVKQEFFLVKDEKKEILISFELRDVELSVDENVFKIPEDFRQVSLKEYQKSIQTKDAETK